MGFPKNDHFGVFWRYHYWRKHPYKGLFFHVIPYINYMSRVLCHCSLRKHGPTKNGAGSLFVESTCFFQKIFRSEVASVEILRILTVRQKFPNLGNRTCPQLGMVNKWRLFKGCKRDNLMFGDQVRSRLESPGHDGFLLFQLSPLCTTRRVFPSSSTNKSHGSRLPRVSKFSVPKFHPEKCHPKFLDLLGNGGWKNFQKYPPKWWFSIFVFWVGPNATDIPTNVFG